MLFFTPSSTTKVTCGTNRVVSRLATRVWTNPAALCKPYMVSFCSFSEPMTDT